MQYNPGDGSGIVDEINDICNSDNNNYPLESKARRVNAAVDRFYTLAFQSDGRFPYDDVNHGTQPIESVNLVNGTQAYSLSAFTSEIFNILRVEILDSAGDSHVLSRLDRSKVTTGLSEYKSTDGIPEEYDLIGNKIYLYPAPNYSSTNGLTLYFERHATRIDAYDTTTTIGVPLMFEPYICRLAALPYLIEMQKAQKNDVAVQVQQDERAIQEHFNSREKGVHKTFSAYIEDTK